MLHEMNATELGAASAGSRATASNSNERDGLVRRARRLVWLGLSWHFVEATVAIGSGVVASSIALIGFGADSVIEVLAGAIVLWRFAAIRAGSDSAEHAGHRLIAVSFYGVAGYVALQALVDLISGDHPSTSWVGIGLAVFALVTMPPLAVAKSRVADRLDSATAKGESRQTVLCAYLSLALLLGLTGNALLGVWWLDPASAIVIAAAAAREGRHAWRGAGCCAMPHGLGAHHEQEIATLKS
jgi:divalent metal cation (Fe/Co/Zn/Cd) transporter